MITRAQLRSSAAPWVIAPALIYTVLYVNDSVYVKSSYYAVQSGEAAAYGIAAIAPAVAATAAWEAGRQRLLGTVRDSAARGPVRRFLRAAAPVLALQLALSVAALFLARVTVGVWPGEATGLLALAHLFLLPAGWLVIGWALGNLMPRGLAAPLAAVGCWVWLAVPQATGNPYIRHLGGSVDTRSSVTDVQEPAAYTVPWLVVAGFAIAAVALAGARRRPWLAPVALAVAAAGFLTGRALVLDWGYQVPTKPRDITLHCVGAEPRVCVPPEYAYRAVSLRIELLTPLDELTAAGVPAPREIRLDSSERPLEPGVWPLYWAPPPDAPKGMYDTDRHIGDLADSAAVGTAVPRAGAENCRIPGAQARAWAALVIGLPETEAQGSLPYSDWVEVNRIRKLPAPDQSDWFEKSATTGLRCPEDPTR
ncbi:hypothetical protein ABZ714_01205 [Streptomyces sp. NPDC006798]|uniref:DUF7224 domain-containing protein n=1 Tax=Streptomyces sp. NPDC006798 TaxID=3155462 RepID=UPI0033CA34B6